MKEFFDEVEGIAGTDWRRAMDGDISHLLDGAKFGEKIGAEVVLKGLFVDQCAEFIVVGELEVGVVGIEPVNGSF